MRTRTGGYPIGFRRSGAAWQRDLDELLAWAQANELEVVDLGRDAAADVPRVLDAGLRVGSVDLPDWQGMISPDGEARAAALAENGAYVRACAARAPMNFFLVMLPADKELPRADNFGYMVESFAALAPVLETADSRLVIEGWPGPGALCCTPETYRAFFQAVPSMAMGINYDPSHLLRQGIDPLRFLAEFGERVFHVHGKDTEMLSEGLYEYGHEQPATFAERIPYGAHAWRYTIPGQGCMRWGEAFRMLAEMGYAGCVSIELEDAHFRDNEAAQQMGIVQGATFLRGC